MLQLNDNKIFAPDHQLVMPDSLIWLDMRNNEMTNMPSFSAPLKNVSVLLLSGNYFPNITNETFAQFPKLKVLLLQNCSTSS
jgi:Leucine-rich repeat (LRR) protein